MFWTCPCRFLVAVRSLLSLAFVFTLTRKSVLVDMWCLNRSGFPCSYTHPRKYCPVLSGAG
ncbi:hypothetical protein DL89DRAFT_270010, partial [Linderina pennispora]